MHKNDFKTSSCLGKIREGSTQTANKLIAVTLKAMKNFTLLLFAICIAHISFSQIAPEIEWQNTIGGENYDELHSIQQTLDGGYILGGFSYSDISGDKTEASNGGYDYWVVKVDSFGEIEWQNTIGGNSDDFLYSIQQTFDGDYILGGYT